MRLGIPGISRSLVKGADDRRKRIHVGAPTHEYVEVTVALEDFQAVTSRLLPFEVLERANLTVRKEAPVQRAGQERPAGLGRHRNLQKIRGQSGMTFHTPKPAGVDAGEDLIEERQRN